MIDNFPKYYFNTPEFEHFEIGDVFNDFFNEFASLIATMFNLLDSIEIFGVGLANLLFSFFIIGIIIPIILTMVHSRSIGYQREKGRQKRWVKDHPDYKGKKG